VQGLVLRRGYLRGALNTIARPQLVGGVIFYDVAQPAAVCRANPT
jgi:hypothetical protein